MIEHLKIGKTQILHQEAEPGVSRSQVEPGNEYWEVLPPLLQEYKNPSALEPSTWQNSQSSGKIIDCVD
ncbi:hypothetical protein [Floridanema evergladense]|uniref:Transposase n=1 Tax=Floridaenema evergladense BLCC-F167 TaxID=3153639 RepID=A0ABV4WRM7_9CYAN